MTRICCNTADDKPHSHGCAYAIGNPLNRPCAKHSMRGCPDCHRRSFRGTDEFPGPIEDRRGRRLANPRTWGKGESRAPASPSTPASARESGPFYSYRKGGDGVDGAAAVAMRMAGGNHAVCTVDVHCIGSDWQQAQQIAAGLNMLHAVSAGTAGIGAPAALEDSIPIRMVLHCPRCGLQHIDKPEPESGWTNPPHKSHLCHGCGCIWRPAEVPTNGVPGLTATGRADNWFPGSPSSLDARIAIMDALAGVRDDFSTPDAAAALDEAMRRVTELCGIGLPEQPRAPGDLGEWVTSRRFPEHGVLRVTAFIIGSDGFCEVMAMSDDPAIERVSGPFWDFQRAEAPPTRYAWDSEASPSAADPPTPA